MLEFFKGTVTPKDWAFVGVVLAIAALLGAGFYFGVYKKQNERLAVIQEELKTTEAELKEAVAISQTYEEFKQQAETAEKLVQVFEERLPEEREIPSCWSSLKPKPPSWG